MVELQRETLDQIYAHAKAEFPEECCGIILSDREQEFVRRCKNVQNQQHAEDPKTYPRDARTAYLMDATDLIKIHKEADTDNRPIKVFYHSHPDTEAYFSEKDKADAMFWDEPTYPDATYVVISICEQEVKVAKAFRWSEAEKDFVEVPIAVKSNS